MTRNINIPIDDDHRKKTAGKPNSRHSMNHGNGNRVDLIEKRRANRANMEYEEDEASESEAVSSGNEDFKRQETSMLQNLVAIHVTCCFR